MAVDIGIFFSNHGAGLGKEKSTGGESKKENWEKKIGKKGEVGSDLKDQPLPH
jgi:hypothetical protein